MSSRYAIRPEELREWEMRNDPVERGRRLTAFKLAIEGKELIEILPGIWRYETVRSGAALT